jgi:PAS domain S-box-containing protein
MAWDRQSKGLWLRYAIVPLLPCCAAALRVALLGGLMLTCPYLTFYPAVMLAALLGGFPAGLLATALSGLLATYFLLEPIGSLNIDLSADRMDLAVFLTCGAVISLFAELMLRARARADAARASLADEKERASLALQRERNFLRQVIDTFPSSIFVKDEQGTLRLVNRAMADFYGTTVQEMEGKGVAGFGTLPEALMARFAEEDREIFASAKALHSGAEILDSEGKLHCFEADKTPLFNEDGSCDKLLVVTTDITDRKQAEEDLRKNRELLNSIISGTPDAIYVKDTAGKYLLFNRAAEEITGKRSEEVLGRRDSELFPHRDALVMAEGDQAAATSRSIVISEDFITDAKGRRRTFLSTKGPLYDEQGTFSGTFGVSRDISEQKQAEKEIHQLNDELDIRVAERTAQLEAANREQEAFSYSVSHDLRSPLRHINSYAAILTEELGSGISATARDNLERICKASSRMGTLIDDLLELARTSRLPLKEEPIDLTRLATISSLLLQQTDKTRRVKFTIADGMQVQGDKTLLRLVLENLLDNAWKYTVGEKTAQIEFGLEVIDGQEVFFISDNGTGFDMEYCDKLFGPFQRLHGAEYEGNGIGLATVKRAIERHGGSVWAEGEVGSGATFYFTLGKDAISIPRQARQQRG